MQDLLTRDTPPASPGTFADELMQAVGCLCEVRHLQNNTLVFLGRVQNFNGWALSVWPTGGKEAPPVIYNDEYKLILHIHHKPALSWRGTICGNTRSFWKLDHLTRCHFKEQRVNFRQTTNLRANLLCLNSIYPDMPRRAEAYFARLCRVVDISLGGLQIRTQDSYQVGDYLLVMNLCLDPSQPTRPFLFTTQVRWAEQVNRIETRLGCSFEPMSVHDEDRLCAAILELQRTDIASRGN